MLKIPLPRDEAGRVEPAIIRLVPAAEDYFDRFVKEHDQQTQAISHLALQYHYAKLEAVAARLALIFYLCDAATGQLSGPMGVQEHHILAGIALARWFGREACRVYAGLTSEGELEKAELLKMVRDHGGSITLREMAVRRRWRNRSDAEAAMQALKQAGLGTMSLDSQGPNGGGQHLRFRLIDDHSGSADPRKPRDSGGGATSG